MSFGAGFIILLLLAFWLSAKMALKPVYSLFCSFCIMVVFLSAAGMANLIWAGTLCFVLLTLALCGLHLFRVGAGQIKKELRAFFTPVLCVYLIAVFLMAVIFFLQKPMFIYWDEFSFWGMAAKVTKVSDLLYTVAPGVIGNVTPCGSVVLSYFFQFFRADFSENIHYLSSVAFYFSAFALVAQLVWEKTKQLSLTALAFLLLFFLPMFFNNTGRLENINQVLPVYITAMVDLHMALCFAAAIILYLLHPGKKMFVLPLVALPLFKDVGLVMGMLAAGIITVLLLLNKQERKQACLFKLHGMPAALITGVLAILAPFATYMGWTMYTSTVFARNQFNLGGAENMSMPTMMLTGLKELLLPGQRTEKFSTIFGNMLNHLINVRTALIGTGLAIVLIILVILAGVFCLSKKEEKIQVAGFTLLSVLAFAAYCIFLGFTYVYVFRGTEGYDLAGFDRYLNTYLIGWVVLALAFAARYIEKIAVVLPIGITGAAAAATALYFFFIGPAHSFVAANSLRYMPRLQVSAPAVQAMSKHPATSGEKVFIISQGQDGMASLYLSFDLYPALVNGNEEGFGDTVGTIALPGTETGTPYTIYTSKEKLAQLLTEQFSLLYIDKIDAVFEEQYGLLFSDGLSQFKEGTTRLYRVAPQAGGAVLVPCEEEAA